MVGVRPAAAAVHTEEEEEVITTTAVRGTVIDTAAAAAAARGDAPGASIALPKVPEKRTKMHAKISSLDTCSRVQGFFFPVV